MKFIKRQILSSKTKPKVSVISYKTLFKYAYDEWKMEWAECHKTFLSANALEYNGTTETFYEEDSEDELYNECFPPMFREPYSTALKIIHFFMLDNGYNSIKFKHY
jgi:hypothetical protein